MNDKQFNIQPEDLTSVQLQFAECIGFEEYKALIMELGGLIILIPTRHEIISTIRKRKIIEDYFKRSLSFEELAKKYMVSDNYVRQLIRETEEQQAKVRSQKQFRKKRNQQIRQDYKNLNLTCKQLGEKYGLSPVTISEIIRLPKEEAQEKSRAIDERNRQIVADWRESHSTQRELAQKYGLSEWSIWNILNNSEKHQAKKQALEERNRKIINDRKKYNYTCKELSERYSLSPSAISDIVNDAESRRKEIEERNKKICDDYYRLNLTYKQLGELYHMSPSQIGKIVRRKKS